MDREVAHTDQAKEGVVQVEMMGPSIPNPIINPQWQYSPRLPRVNREPLLEGLTKVPDAVGLFIEHADSEFAVSLATTSRKVELA